MERDLGKVHSERRGKRLFLLLLWVCLMGMSVPGTVRAGNSSTEMPEGKNVGDFTVAGDEGSYSYSKNTLTITGSGALTISGTSTADCIVVGEGVNANITLDGVNIEFNDGSERNAIGGTHAFRISAGAIVNLTLSGENTLDSGYACDGLAAGEATLVITKKSEGGSLQAIGGNYGAGIRVGTIIIEGGTVTAMGGRGSAGIGGSSNKNGGIITINGGQVTAMGGRGAAGIGGGSGKSGGKITINKGQVNAKGGSYGAGIGGGQYGSGGEIIISGGQVTAIGGYGESGIGGGEYGSGGEIIISGGVVTCGEDLQGNIGCGSKASGSDFMTQKVGEANGNAVIFGRIENQTGKSNNSWSGVIFEGDNGRVYGDVTPTEDFTMEVGQTLMIPEDSALTIPQRKALTNNGTIILEGSLDGNVEGSGRILCKLTVAGATVTPDDSMMDVSADAADSDSQSYYVTNGASVEITAMEPEGKKFAEWQITGLSEEVDTVKTPLTFTMPVSKVAVSAVCKKLVHITATSDADKLNRTYTGTEIDVSELFLIDENAGTAAYTLVTGTDRGTGTGSIAEGTDKLSVSEVGTFVIQVATAAHGEYAAGEATAVLNVSPAELTVTGAAAEDRAYDGTDTVRITGVTLDGVKGGDRVVVDVTGLTGTLGSSHAGTYTEVTLPNGLELTGDQAENYTLVWEAGSPVAASVTVSPADAEITVGTAAYDKVFGDADFTLDAADTNPEAEVQYEVKTGTDVVSVSNGTVTILKAGTAAIAVTLPASTNYHAAASKEITVNVAKKSGYAVDAVNRRYLYLRENGDRINLSGLLPADCGAVVCAEPQTSGTVEYRIRPAVTDDTLSYTVESGEVGAAGTITVNVVTDNYADIPITVNVALIDQTPIRLQEGSDVTLQNNALTYGEALSGLVFNNAVFVDDNETPVAGRLAWKEPSAVPNAGTPGATWVFTPESEEYAVLEGNVDITVEKATPEVTALPTVAIKRYDPSACLSNSDLRGGAADTAGTWGWQTAGVVPTVNNNGYEAVFTPDDTLNYKTVTRTITVNVEKAAPYIAVLPEASQITYGDVLGISALTGGMAQYSEGDAAAVAGVFEWKEPSVRPSVADSGRTEYIVVFIPTDQENCNAAERAITLTVNKAQSAPNMPDSAMDAEGSCKKIGEVPLPEGWEWQEADKDTALEAGRPMTAAAI
ncbi:MAG: YDG domain-containing protein, partial [Kineothrix sp.]